MIKKISAIIRLLRPLQWLKNGFVLAPLLFSQKALHIPSLINALEAAGVFCLLSSAIYIINDIFDINADRVHPQKKNRPLAAKLISVPLALFLAILLILCAGWGAWVINGQLLIVIIVYFGNQVLYNLVLKKSVLIDVFSISFGFFLRVFAGAAVINVQMSSWLIICTMLLAMFITIGKRRQEIALLGRDLAGSFKPVLRKYSEPFLDQLMTIVAGCSLLSYILYCVSAETIGRFHTDRMILSTPFVAYGLFRYLYLIHSKNHQDAPEKLLVTDMPLLLSVIFWGITCFLIVYKIL